MAEEPTSPSRVVFGPLEADLRTGELRKNGRRLRLSKQPFQVLAMLLETPGELVTRQELKSRLWPEDTFVDFDDSLNAAVNKLRQVLGDSAGNPKLIETLHGRGYCFVGETDQANVGVQADSLGPTVPARRLVPRQTPFAAWVPWALLVVAIGYIVVSWLGEPKSVVELPLRRFSFQPENLITGRTARPVISPNGRYVAYVVQDGNRTRLAVYDLGLEQSRQLEGTQDARAPFWSPESDFIGFFADGVLKKIRVEGGAAVSLSRVPLQSAPAGSWSAGGDSIIISGRGLQSIPASGGALTTIGESKFYMYPHSLPLEASSRGLVFSRILENRVMLQNLKTGEQELLARGASPVYSLTGHLIYQTRGRTRGLWALPFSLDSLKSTGEAIPIARNGFYPSVASDGTLVYVDQPELPQRQLVWRDRNGKKLGVIGQPQRAMEFASMSPDGRYVALTAQEGGNTDIWLYDVQRSTRERFTFDPAIDNNATWSPDSSRVAFASGRNQTWDLFIKPADGHADARQLLATPSNKFVNDWSPDGRVLSYHKFEPGFGADLWSLELSQDESDNKATLYLQTPSSEHSAKFSPDGRYIAYLSRESGRDEVYVRTFPEAEGKRQVSFNGGVQPRWSRDGKELFYVEGETLIAVSVTTEPRFEAGKAKRLFSDPNLTWQDRTMPQYDVSPDGQRFVMIESVGERSRPVIRVVQNWYEEFRDREQD